MSERQQGGEREHQRAAFERLAAFPMPTFVFNALTTNVTATEVSTILSLGQRPVALLVMSPPMAKTFGQLLLGLVQEYEQITGQSVKSLQEMNSVDQPAVA